MQIETETRTGARAGTRSSKRRFAVPPDRAHRDPTVLGMIPIAPTVFWGPMAYAIMGGLRSQQR